jgi:ferredoxin-thioredoxin reductase catalytic subunit
MKLFQIEEKAIDDIVIKDRARYGQAYCPCQ